MVLTPFQYSAPSTLWNNEEKKRVKMGGVKLSLFSDNMVLDIRDPKYSLRKLLERNNNFSKMATYKNELMNISRPTLNSLRKR